MSDRILTARYILLQSGFASRALSFYNYPIHPTSLLSSFLFFPRVSFPPLPLLSALHLFFGIRTEKKRRNIYIYIHIYVYTFECIIDYSHWDERGRADSAAKEPSMAGIAPFPTNRCRTGSHRCVPETKILLVGTNSKSDLVKCIHPRKRPTIIAIQTLILSHTLVSSPLTKRSEEKKKGMRGGKVRREEIGRNKITRFDFFLVEQGTTAR